MAENETASELKTFGYHPARDYGGDVMPRGVFLRNVDVEIEYGYSGQVIGIFIRKPRAATEATEAGPPEA